MTESMKSGTRTPGQRGTGGGTNDGGGTGGKPADRSAKPKGSNATTCDEAGARQEERNHRD